MSKRWYVVHAYSGFEKSVQRALVERVARDGMQDFFGQILVPVEEVVEMRNGQKSITELKFFPAVQSGGIQMLKAWQGPFGDVRFCPTGGISPANAAEFLALSNVVSTTLRILLIILGFVMIAKEWNYDITGFIASLSIGSLAVALAAKDSLANVFGSLVIIIDKPFVIGDWISANGIEGTVEKITFRSTCLRTFPQELVYIPNSLLSNTAITNFSKREKRRLDFVLGLTYDTTYQQMEKFVGRLREYLMHHDGVYDDGITVNFQDFGGSSLDIRIICYTKASAYASFMDVRQQINIDIMKMLEEENLGCAFPSTSVYFETPLVQKQAAPPTDAPKTEVQA